jgi:hypothetical protein
MDTTQYLSSQLSFIHPAMRPSSLFTKRRQYVVHRRADRIDLDPIPQSK